MLHPIPTRGSLAVAVLLLLVAGGSGRAHGSDQPLAPADTSSPRATLQSFVETVDAMHDDLLHHPPSADQRVRFRRR